MGWLIRTGGVLVCPRNTFRFLLSGRAGGLGDILLLLLVVVVGTAPVSVARIFLGSQAGFGLSLTRFFSLYFQFAIPPLLACVAAALVLAGVCRFQGRRVAIEGVVSSAMYLWVPVAVLGLLGSMLQSLGLDLWVLPHVPFTVFLQNQPPWWLIAVRIAVAYAWSAYLAWVLFSAIGEEEKEPVSAPARTGAFLLGCWILLSWLTGGVTTATQYDRIRPVQAGDRAADFDLSKLDGKNRLTLSSLAGRPVVLDFWATWCPKCVSSMPELIAWAKRHPGVAVVAIHQGDDADTVRAFVEERKWEGIVFLVDEKEETRITYRVDTLPSTFVVRPDGIVAGGSIGSPPRGWLDRLTGGAATGTRIPPASE